MFLEIDEMTSRANVHSGQGSEGMHDLPVKKLGRKTSCLKCYDGGDVLVCSHGDCPIVIHESCMSCTARLNDSGNFCCPYCLYNQSLAECHQAKEKVLSAKNALSCFLDITIIEKIGNLQKSKCSKRKIPDSPTCMRNGNGATCTEVESMQVEGDQQDDNPECQTLAGDELAAGQPKSSCGLGRGTAAKEIETLTKRPRENLDTVSAYQCGSNGKIEQTQDERQKTFGCSTRMDTETVVHEESKKGSYSPIQDDATSKMEVNSENVQNPSEIGENHCSGADEGLQNAIRSTLDDNVLVTHEEIGNLTEKHQENLKTVGEQRVEKIQLQSNPQETPICLMRNVNRMKMPEQYPVRSQTEVHLQDVDQSADVEGLCVDQEKRSVINASHTVKKDIVPLTKVESGNLTAKYQEIANTVEILHEGGGGGEKKQLGGEPEEISLCLKGKQNTTELDKEYDKVNDGTCQDDSYTTSQMVVNSENAGHLAQSREDHDDGQTQVKSSEDVLNLMRKNCVSMTLEESGNLFIANQGSGEKAEKYQDGVVEKEHSHPETQQNTFHLTTNDDAMRMHEVSDRGNDQSAETGDYCGRTNEQQKVELPINDVHWANDTVSVVHEDSEGGDSSASVGDSFCMGHGVSSKRKSPLPESLKNDNQPEGLSESSESEFSESEEYEEKTPGKSVENMDPRKRVQHSALRSARRAKLPWTVEEVEMLQEGVQKFSLTAKKNLPWMKILEFGRHIFDGTRTPVDLKDKWRNIMGKGL